MANFWQTLRGPFSAVSKPNFASLILVWKLLTRSTRFTHFCTAAISISFLFFLFFLFFSFSFSFFGATVERWTLKRPNTVKCLAVKCTLLGTRHPRKEKEELRCKKKHCRACLPVRWDFGVPLTQKCYDEWKLNMEGRRSQKRLNNLALFFVFCLCWVRTGPSNDTAQ